MRDSTVISAVVRVVPVLLAMCLAACAGPGSTAAPPTSSSVTATATTEETMAASSPAAAQRKIDPNLRAAMARARGEPINAPLGLPVEVSADGTTPVDIRAEVTDAVVQQIQVLGARVTYTSVPTRSIVADAPLDRLEVIAQLDAVRFIVPLQRPLRDPLPTPGS